jgi:hypothetical protein
MKIFSAGQGLALLSFLISFLPLPLCSQEALSVTRTGAISVSVIRRTPISILTDALEEARFNEIGRNNFFENVKSGQTVVILYGNTQVQGYSEELSGKLDELREKYPNVRFLKFRYDKEMKDYRAAAKAGLFDLPFAQLYADGRLVWNDSLIPPTINVAEWIGRLESAIQNEFL